MTTGISGCMVWETQWVSPPKPANWKWPRRRWWWRWRAAWIAFKRGYA